MQGELIHHDFQFPMSGGSSPFEEGSVKGGV